MFTTERSCQSRQHKNINRGLQSSILVPDFSVESVLPSDQGLFFTARSCTIYYGRTQYKRTYHTDVAFILLVQERIIKKFLKRKKKKNIQRKKHSTPNNNLTRKTVPRISRKQRIKVIIILLLKRHSGCHWIARRRGYRALHFASNSTIHTSIHYRQAQIPRKKKSWLLRIHALLIPLRSSLVKKQCGSNSNLSISVSLSICKPTKLAYRETIKIKILIIYFKDGPPFVLFYFHKGEKIK